MDSGGQSLGLPVVNRNWLLDKLLISHQGFSNKLFIPILLEGAGCGYIIYTSSVSPAYLRERPV